MSGLLPVVDVELELSHKDDGPPAFSAPACASPCLCHTDFARSLFRFVGLL